MLVHQPTARGSSRPEWCAVQLEMRRPPSLQQRPGEHVQRKLKVQHGDLVDSMGKHRLFSVLTWLVVAGSRARVA